MPTDGWLHATWKWVLGGNEGTSDLTTNFINLIVNVNKMNNIVVYCICLVVCVQTEETGGPCAAPMSPSGGRMRRPDHAHRDRFKRIIVEL